MFRKGRVLLSKSVKLHQASLNFTVRFTVFQNCLSDTHGRLSESCLGG